MKDTSPAKDSIAEDLIDDVANAASGDALLEPIIQPAANPWVSIVLLGVLSLIWGTSFILIKKGTQVFTPIEAGNIRIFTAFCVLAPFAVTRLKGIPRKAWTQIILSGFIGSYLPAFMFALAGAHLSSAISGSLNALSPLFTVLVGVGFFSTRISKLGFWGILIGLAGALALSLSKLGSSADALQLDIWALPIVVATVMYAANLNMIKANLKHVDSLTISSVSLLVVGVIAGIFLFGFTGFLDKLYTEPEGFWFSLGCLVTLGLFSTAIALVLYNRLIKFTSTVVAASVTYLIPVVSVAWGLLDGERIQSYHYIGLVLIIAGVFLVNRK